MDRGVLEAALLADIEDEGYRFISASRLRLSLHTRRARTATGTKATMTRWERGANAKKRVRPKWSPARPQIQAKKRQTRQDPAGSLQR